MSSMVISKIQFDILYILTENPDYQLNQIARLLFHTPEHIRSEYEGLVKESFIQRGRVTDKGWDYLNKHKVENAVILAAGMSTRFVPFNFEKPKGLLSVKGEVLIERQI